MKKCLRALLEKTKYVDYSVYLMANDPNDEVKKAIHDTIFVDDIQITNKIIPIFNDSNEGSFSSNNNEVAGEGNGDFILFLNDDCEPINENWLLNMSSALQDQSICAVGGLLLYPNNLIQHCGVFFSHKTNGLPYHMYYRKSPKAVKGFISVPRLYQAVTGACLMVRRTEFEKVGGFNCEYYYCYEDIDLCLNLSKKFNKRCLYTPGAVLTHHEGISSSEKNNPHLQKNIQVFRNRCSGKYYNDLDFYLSDPNFGRYKRG